MEGMATPAQWGRDKRLPTLDAFGSGCYRLGAISLRTSVKAVVQRGFGGVDVLSYEDVADPSPGANDVVVRVGATSLNRLDVLQRVGPALVPGFTLPHIAGLDVAGTVVDKGAEVGSVVDGERVVVNPLIECGRCAACLRGDFGLCANLEIVGGSRAGGYAEYCIIPAKNSHRLPDDASFEEAATIPTVFSMAWNAIVLASGLQGDETILIHGAGSSLSLAAIQIAKKRFGARVIVTSRSAEKLEIARSVGADETINVTTEDFVARCRELTDGIGVDVALDHVGPATFEATLFALRPRGRLVFCGNTTGTRVQFDLPYAYQFGITLIGAGPHDANEFQRMLDFYFASDCKAVIDSYFALSDAGAGQLRMESGEHAGKILLVP
jgi:NADPH:quinone reductase-like Zn-dependent oxidoreductase